MYEVFETIRIPDICEIILDQPLAEFGNLPQLIAGSTLEKFTW